MGRIIRAAEGVRHVFRSVNGAKIFTDKTMTLAAIDRLVHHEVRKLLERLADKSDGDQTRAS